MSQKQRILKYLKNHKRITQWSAIELGVLRLSERIRELEADGVNIVHVPLTKDGHRVMSYSLR